MSAIYKTYGFVMCAANLMLLKFKDALQKHKEDDLGQGTTEYAILVGVIVVIAIIAVALFKDKIQELWDAIVSGINSL